MALEESKKGGPESGKLSKKKREVETLTSPSIRPTRCSSSSFPPLVPFVLIPLLSPSLPPSPISCSQPQSSLMDLMNVPEPSPSAGASADPWGAGRAAGGAAAAPADPWHSYGTRSGTRRSHDTETHGTPVTEESRGSEACRHPPEAFCGAGMPLCWLGGITAGEGRREGKEGGRTRRRGGGGCGRELEMLKGK